MKALIASHQKEGQLKFKQFVEQNIAPFADQIDSDQFVSPTIITSLAKEGYLGAIVSNKYGGSGMDLTTYGLLNEEIGKACSSVRSLITVQNMVTGLIQRWGNSIQKENWLPKLASGEQIAAFALTEPQYGSDANHIQTSFTDEGKYFVVNGHKKWITFGQIANVILTLGQLDGKLCALLIEKDTPGFTMNPMKNILGVRGSMLAELVFNDCQIPKENQIGGIGFGLNPVGFSALDMGRYSIACGCVGMAEACLKSSVDYANNREQFGVKIKEHQLIKRLISNMMVDIEAARMLCYHAGILKEENDPEAIKAMLYAKYYASNMAVRVSEDALQIHGANGFSHDYPVERFNRDAKIMTMIEGSNQMMQLMISKYAFL